MKRFDFVVRGAGYGNTPEEAWDDFCEAFAQDSGAVPEEYTVEEEPEEVEA